MSRRRSGKRVTGVTTAPVLVAACRDAGTDLANDEDPRVVATCNTVRQIRQGRPLDPWDWAPATQHDLDQARRIVAQLDAIGATHLDHPAAGRTPDVTTNYREHEMWTTVGVTALPPGWRNVYAWDGQLVTVPCPALLLQENRANSVSWDVEGGTGTRRTGKERQMEPPYDTRVVFAAMDLDILDSAGDASNYLGTVGPDQDPSILARPEAVVPTPDPTRSSGATDGHQ